MPIHPDLRRHYRKHWHRLAYNLRIHRAGNVCECTGLCGGHEGPCGASHGNVHPRTGGRAVLTCAHLDQDPHDHDPARLLVLCASCHLRYDRQPEQRALRQRVYLEAHGQLSLVDDRRSLEKARRDTFRRAQLWVRAIRASTLHPPLFMADRAQPHPFNDIVHRIPMTVHRFAALTSHLPGLSRSTILRRMKQRPIPAVGTLHAGGIAVTYDPLDILRAAIGADAANWVFTGDSSAGEL